MTDATYEKICKLGSAVMLKTPFLGQPAGTKALVYEVYQIGNLNPLAPGVSILTENGKDLGGYSKDDIERHLIHLGQVTLDVQINTQTELYRALGTGLFNAAFAQLAKIRLLPGQYGYQLQLDLESEKRSQLAGRPGRDNIDPPVGLKRFTPRFK